MKPHITMPGIYQNKIYKVILDTDTLKVEVYENPYALNFIKLDVNRLNDLIVLNSKYNIVTSIKCPYGMKDEIATILNNNENIIEYRLNIDMSTTNTNMESNYTELTNTDHLKDFIDFVH